MRSALSTLAVVRPRRLAEAIATLASAGGREKLVPLAGGTDLFVYLNAGTQPVARYLDLWGLRELRGITVRTSGITFGALTTFAEVRAHPAVRRRFPSLVAAAAEVGAAQIQHRATIAGNIANASPAGDSLPVLLAYDAVVHVRSTRGARDVAFADLYTGYRKLAIEPDELIVGVTLPSPPARHTAFFRKVGTRRAQSISKVVFCGLLAPGARGTVSAVRLAYGSVAPVPVRARNAEAAIEGRRPARDVAIAARAVLLEEISPIDDIRSDREYRLAVSGNVLEQFLRTADRRFAK